LTAQNHNNFFQQHNQTQFKQEYNQTQFKQEHNQQIGPSVLQSHFVFQNTLPTLPVLNQQTQQQIKTTHTTPLFTVVTHTSIQQTKRETQLPVGKKLNKHKKNKTKK
jgi:hypothetical protein